MRSGTFTALYWAAATVGTVDYGDVSAISVAEKLVSILLIIAGISGRFEGAGGPAKWGTRDKLD